jgi:hypothetical protein
MMKETKRDILKATCKSIEEARSSFESHWQDIADYTYPRSYRWLDDDWTSRGNKANKKIIDPTATLACRTLVAFFSSGITPSSRPWKAFKASDARFNGDHEVKEYLAETNELMDGYILQSNFYQEASKVYEQCALFGTAAMLVEEDNKTHFRCETLPAGSYYLGVDPYQRVNQMFRKVQMTARQMASAFGYDNLSDKVKEAFDNKNLRDKGRFEVWHYVGPNDAYDGRTLDKEFMSCYMEAVGDTDKLLRESGYDEFPVIAVRWKSMGDDVYGQDCPGQIILGSIKELQHAWKQIHKAWEKQVNPPLNAPESSRRTTIETFAGAVNYHDSRSAQDGIRPTYQVQFDTQGVMMGVQDLRSQIKDAFFYNQFMMVADNRRSGTKAREIEELADEKMNSLATTYEQFSNEFLDPFVNRAYNICNRRGVLPEPPAQFQGTPFTIEYVSVMAQAMKMVGIGNMDRALAIMGQVGTIRPEVTDIMDADKFVTQYWERLGVDARTMSSPDEIKGMRDMRAQQQAQQQQMQDTQVQADTAKVLSDTKIEQDSALSALVNQTRAFQ